MGLLKQKQQFPLHKEITYERQDWATLDTRLGDSCPVPDVFQDDDADVEEGEDVRRCYDIPGIRNVSSSISRNLLFQADCHKMR